MKKYVFDCRPQAHKDACVVGPHYRFTVLADGLLRYEWAADGKFENRASTFAINRDLPVPDFKVVDTADELEIITDRFHVSYDKKRFSASGFMASFNDKITQWGAQWRFGDYGDDELGADGRLRKNLGGTARTLDEVDGRCSMGTGVLSRFGYAALDDSETMLFDGKGFVCGREQGDRIDGYLFCYGHDYKQAIKTFYAVSGRQPLLPRWALGNWWSRYHPYSQDGYISLMDKFKHRKIPLSVAVIDMDWHLVRDHRVSHAGWTGYTWNEKLFPDPAKFGRDLHSRNLKITLNDHPHSGVHAFEDSYEEMAKFLNHDPTGKRPILFDPTNPKFMEAFFNILHRKVEDTACDFWWIDWQQGAHSKIPGVDPLWVLNHFHFLDNAQNGRRPLIFSRYAGPGSHRYPVGFSGDTIISWASLDFQPEFTATASNIGYGWWSHDIGGHMLGYRDDELVTRWVQFGVFSPIMRLHSSNSRWTSKEPWLYRKENEVIMEKFLRLRHRLIPYLYNHNIAAATHDEPLVQPMYWSFPERREAYSVYNQYSFGSELIVAPITTPRHNETNLGHVKAWLPPSSARHVDIFTGTVYDSDRTLNLYRTLSDFPVLAHEGSIIPLDASPDPGNGGRNPTSVEVLIVVGADGHCSMLEDPNDDDVATDSHRHQHPHKELDERASAEIHYVQSEAKLTVQVTNPNQRHWTFRFLSLAPTVEASDLKIILDGNNVHHHHHGYKVTHTSYPDSFPGMVVSLSLPPTTHHDTKSQPHNISIQLPPSYANLHVIDHRPRIRDLLLDYQTPFSVKDQIWEIIDGEKAHSGTKVAELLALGLQEELLGPMLELLLADSRTG